MSVAKVAITLDETVLHRVDRLVNKHLYPSRSRVIQDAVQEKLERLDRSRLARECARLDRKEEQSLAEEGMTEEMKKWPEY